MMAWKKAFATALALSLPLSALAQTPAVEPAKPAEAAPAPAPAAKPAEPAKAPLAQVYGTLNVNLQYTETTGATVGTANVKPRMAVSIDSSNIGVRGSLELVHGLKGIYQCETQASVDGEDVRGICNRNSSVGLSSAWGTLFYGNWDTPFKSAAYGTKADDPFGNTDVFGFQGLLGSPGYGVRSSAFNGGPAASVTASFDQRAANSVGYWTPKFAGLGAKVQYSVDEFRSANGLIDPMLLAAAVTYDIGGLSVVGTVEYHEDAYGLRVINPQTAGTPPAPVISNVAAKDLGWRLAAGYNLPLGVGTLNVMGMVEQLMYEQEGATIGFKSYDRYAWLVGAKFRTGNHELRARYSQAMDPNITAASGTTLAAAAEEKLGANSYAFGYAYHLAKSTQVFAYYTQIMNDDRARYTFGVSGAAAVVGANTAAGADPSAAGLGIRLGF